jgi:hypothetical protein
MQQQVVMQVAKESNCQCEERKQGSQSEDQRPERRTCFGMAFLKPLPECLPSRDECR